MRFSEAEVFSVDTETTGLYYPRDKMFGFSVAVPGESVYFDIRQSPGSIDWFNDEISRWKGRRIVNHNISFDYKMMTAAGFNLPIDKLECTTTRACLIDETLLEYSLDFLAKKYLKRQKVEIYDELAKVFGGRPTRNVQIGNLQHAHPDLVRPYATIDADLALELWWWQETEIDRQGIRKIVDFERSVFPRKLREELRGIRVDVREAERAMHKLGVQIAEEQRILDRLAGHSINVNSSPQVKKLFNPTSVNGVWVADNGTILGTTEKGQPSLDSVILREMENDERAKRIITVRSLIKTRDTFLAKHVLEHEINGRVYPTINQNKGEDGGTGTGRFSYTDPAMQQIPSRNKKVASIVKPVFLPEEGNVWLSGDLHSFEVRVFAHLVNDEYIINKYKEDPESDFHQMVADITGLPRNATYSGQANAKQLDLSMIFNSGNGAIAEKMGMPWEISSFQEKKNGVPVFNADGTPKMVVYKKAGEEAMAVIEEYHRRLPGVKRLAENAKKIAESFGYVEDYYGRRFRFPHGHKTYKASGISIQMLAAGMNKQNHILVEEALGSDGHLVLNTHDSYDMSVQENWKPVWDRVKHHIEGSFPWFRVPVVLDLNGAGKNWWEAVK